MSRFLKTVFSLLTLSLVFASCATLFGWDIHAPGVLSGDFERTVTPAPARVALYVDPASVQLISKKRGDRLADPMTFHVGEAWAPMIVEGFQTAFEEFILLETEPEPALLKRYGIQYLAVARIKGFDNRMNIKKQAVELVTEIVVMDPEMKTLGRYEARGTSDAEKIFSKKGGPETNLNAAVEHNVLGTVQYLQDAIRTGRWQETGS